MNAPFFFIEQIVSVGEDLTLSEETSRHVSGVLRMEIGEKLILTNGKGYLYQTVIEESHKKKTRVSIRSIQRHDPSPVQYIIAISLLRNASRFEWFLEKATEIGITSIIPFISARTEKQYFRYERMKAILISAMLQSQQTWLPQLNQPVLYKDLFSTISHLSPMQKFIAHCEPDYKESLSKSINPSLDSSIILIGPEGDFTSEELSFAKGEHFVPVSLGNTRLRTETAGIVAATLMVQGGAV